MHSRGTRPPGVLLLPTGYTPKLVPFGPDSYCKVPPASQVNMWSFRAGRMRRTPAFRLTRRLKSQLQSELNLPRDVGVGGPQRAPWNPILRRENIDSNALIRLDELGCVALEA